MKRRKRATHLSLSTVIYSCGSPGSHAKYDREDRDDHPLNCWSSCSSSVQPSILVAHNLEPTLTPHLHFSTFPGPRRRGAMSEIDLPPLTGSFLFARTSLQRRLTCETWHCWQDVRHLELHHAAGRNVNHKVLARALRAPPASFLLAF